MPTIISLPGY
ncbi:unnamed protein product [Acanthoscelides obtectus]|uniref:Uncharacterized protein n=1 Tax=Acanthoscelides obtectus TaxID=200917 RepID=A0A9P0KPG7_ACAOB|nr:unnamed protein product [Acanthoscelides obtectus]CAK1655687.1 hypothetical protein AOBTE_LOCUS19262 [Acanthoscelides obtectus]